MTNYVEQGDTVTCVAPRAVNSGDGVIIGQLFGVARVIAAQNASLEILTKGVFDIAKDTSTFTTGAKVYWDDTNHVATSTATSNKQIGIAVLDNPDGTSAPGGQSADATVRVKLLQVAV